MKLAVQNVYISKYRTVRGFKTLLQVLGVSIRGLWLVGLRRFYHSVILGKLTRMFAEGTL